MDFRCSEQDVDAPLLPGGFYRFTSRIDILWHATSQAADGRAFDFLRDGVHRREITFADNGKASLDHIDLQPRELPGHLKLLAQVHGCAWALLAIAERRVEYNNAVTFHIFLSGSHRSF